MGSPAMREAGQGSWPYRYIGIDATMEPRWRSEVIEKRVNRIRLIGIFDPIYVERY